MLKLTGRHFDGWLPYMPDPAVCGDGLRTVRTAAGDRPVEAGMYLTVTLGNESEATDEMDAYLNGYYGVGLDLIGQVQACFAGPAEGAAEWIRGFERVGAEHVIVRLGHRNLDVHAARASELRSAL